MILSKERPTKKKVIFSAKEAGSAALIAAIAKDMNLTVDSVCFISKVAEPYFENLNMIKYICDDNLIPSDVNFEFILRTVDVVIMGASAGFSIEKQIYNRCINKKIPIYAFIDHYWNLWQRFAAADTAVKWAYLPDRIYVMDKVLRERIITQGAPRSRVKVFNNPLLNLKNTCASNREKKAARKILNIGEKTTVVLFVSEYGFIPSTQWQWDQPPESDITALLLILVRSIEALVSEQKQSVLLLIKKHPSDTHEWAIASQKPFCRVIDACAKDVLFGSVDIAFGLNSMMLLEASKCGVPSYSFHKNGYVRETSLSGLREEVIEIIDESECHEKIIDVIKSRSKDYG